MFKVLPFNEENLFSVGRLSTRSFGLFLLIVLFPKKFDFSGVSELSQIGVERRPTDGFL